MISEPSPTSPNVLPRQRTAPSGRLLLSFMLPLPGGTHRCSVRQSLIQSGGDSTSGAKPQIRSSSNTIPMLNITGHVNQYLPIVDASGSADKTWYLFGKLSNSGYAARMNFLRGHESPELCMKNPNKISMGGATMSPLEGDYESD